MAAVGLQNSAVPAEIPGIGLQVLIGAKLGGVDKVGHHHPVALADRFLHQAGMALMEISHGGDQPHGQSLLFPGRHLGPHLRTGCCNQHGLPPHCVEQTDSSGADWLSSSRFSTSSPQSLLA